MKKMPVLAFALAVLALITGCSSLRDQPFNGDLNEKYYVFVTKYDESPYKVLVVNETDDGIVVQGEGDWPHFFVRPGEQKTIHVLGKNPRALLTAFNFSGGEVKPVSATSVASFSHDFGRPEIVKWRVKMPLTAQPTQTNEK